MESEMKRLMASARRADPTPIIHYAPAKNLEHIDVARIDSAKREIDFAAYVLTDWPVMQALAPHLSRGLAPTVYIPHDGLSVAV